MKKDTIYIDLDDEITTITDRVQNSKDKLIALVLPKHCAVLQSAVNMKILNKIAIDNGKTVVLITSESSLLPLAGAASLYVAKTLQSKPYLPDPLNIEETVATIDEQDEGSAIDSSKPIGELALAGGGVAIDDEVPIELGDESVEDEKAVSKGEKKNDKKLHVPNFNKFRIGLVLAILLVFILVGGAVYAAKALPRAKVVVTTQNQTVGVTMSVTGSVTATTVDLANKVVPAEAKTLDQTVTKTFTATGQFNKGDKAKGTMTITNCINDGEAHTVPAGTTFTNGQFSFTTDTALSLNASVYSGHNCRTDLGGSLGFSKDVNVTAVQGGGGYNLSARAYTSQIDGINGYGSAMGGGTDHMVTGVSQADCDSAKNDLLQTSTDDYKNQLSAQLSTSSLLPLRETFTSAPDEVACSPAVGAEATQSIATLALKLSMTGANITGLDQLIKAEVTKQNNHQSVFDTGVSGAIVSVSEKKASGDVVFNLQANAHTGMQQDSTAIANLIAGKKYGESLSAIRSQSGVGDVKISYSPFWVKQTPKNIQRISVSFINQ